MIVIVISSVLCDSTVHSYILLFFPQFSIEVLSGSDKFLPYASERKCVTTDIVSSGVVGLAMPKMTVVDSSTCLGVSISN